MHRSYTIVPTYKGKTQFCKALCGSYSWHYIGEDGSSDSIIRSSESHWTTGISYGRSGRYIGQGLFFISTSFPRHFNFVIFFGHDLLLIVKYFLNEFKKRRLSIRHYLFFNYLCLFCCGSSPVIIVEFILSP